MEVKLFKSLRIKVHHGMGKSFRNKKSLAEKLRMPRFCVIIFHTRHQIDGARTISSSHGLLYTEPISRLNRKKIPIGDSLDNYTIYAGLFPCDKG